jgi:hypothetical protein
MFENWPTIFHVACQKQDLLRKISGPLNCLYLRHKINPDSSCVMEGHAGFQFANFKQL